MSKIVEFTVGLFVLSGLLCLGYLAINLGGLKMWGEESYTLQARFNSIGGLNEGAAVRIAGVNVGTVTAVTLDKQTFVAIVEMRLRPDLVFDDDTMASIKSSGLIGDKYIELTPGYSGNPMSQGEMIVDTESALDIEGLIRQFAFGKVETE